MHKFPIPIAHDTHPAKPRRPRLRTAAIVLLGSCSGTARRRRGLICYAQWSPGAGAEHRGQNADYRFAARQTRSRLINRSGASSHVLSARPLEPELVLAIGAVVVIMGMMMLKL